MDKYKDSFSDNQNRNICECDEKKGLLELLSEHDEKGVVPFHMPGHKRAEYDFLFGAQRFDITEIDGFDNLHDARGIIADSEKRAAELYKTKYARFLVNGSTCGVLATIKSLCSDGDKVLVARNCHKSVFNAIELAHACPVYVAPSYFDELGFYGSVSPQSVADAFARNADIKLVVITSPTYEGIISDISAISQICHAHGALLFVDEAHGAHLGLYPCFEASARNLGADIVVNSLHKTLPSFTQTALLHVCTDRADIRRIDKNLAIFQSSSPSYLLMASIDGCVRYLQNEGERALSTWSRGVDELRKALGDLTRLSLFDCANDTGAFGYDKSKIVVLCNHTSLNGVELKNVLREKYGIELEMAGVRHAVAMTGAGDCDVSFDKLKNALSAIDASIGLVEDVKPFDCIEIPQKVFEPYQIDSLSCEYVELEKCADRISAENAWAYPPGSPLIVKGERISDEMIKSALAMFDCGVDLSSETREFPNKLLVVKDY